MYSDLLSNIELGLVTALSLANLFYCGLGVLIGMLVGVLPGIGSLAALSMLFPVTLHMDPTSSLVMLAGIYYGASYGGSAASILLNVPGEPNTAVTCLDGYPMAKQGRAGAALMMSTVGSFVGGSFGIMLMMLFSPLIVRVAISFSSPEFFSLMLMGLIAASVITTGSPARGLAMVVLGCLVGTIGVDTYTAAPRFTFGFVELMDGINVGAIAMGIFGLTEVIVSINSVDDTGQSKKKISLRSMLPTRDDVRRSWMPMVRGTLIGSFFGALPGAGATIASFVSYGVEKKVADEPSRFGNGAIEGVVAPKSADNAADQTAFIPTLTLGIPATASMALMLGVLTMQGIAPGPTLMTRNPGLFWGLVMSFWVGNLLLLLLNIPLVGLWVRILAIPYKYLYPTILMFICLGVLTVNYSVFDVYVVIVIGVVGYFMRILDFPPAPLLLGFVLGPEMEQHFRRAMLVSQGSFDVFIAKPVSAFFLVISLGMLIFAFWSAVNGRRSSAIDIVE